MTGVQVAGVAHAPALALIHAAAFPPGSQWGADAMALQLGLPGVFGFVAWPSGHAAEPGDGAAQGGMVLARVAADEAEILTLAVLPAARRRGLGRALMRAAMAQAAAAGAAAMLLEVAETNASAQDLYASLGFTLVGRRPRYYAGGGDALLLRASLLGLL